MKVLCSNLWASLAALAFTAAAAAADQGLRHPQQNAAGSGGNTTGTAVASTAAVEDFAALLLNATRSEHLPNASSPAQSSMLQHEPGRLLVKFKELYGGNYSAVAQLVNKWAGIDLVKVRLSCAQGSPHAFLLSL
jgi:hypothetical protein